MTALLSPGDARALHLARFMNTRDGAESGTVGWDDLDDAGRESYLTDATLVIKALARIDAFLAPVIEWEYGAVYQGHDGKWFAMDYIAFAIREAAEHEVDRYADAQIVLGRRRKPGPWEPVDVTEEAR